MTRFPILDKPCLRLIKEITLNSEGVAYSSIFLFSEKNSSPFLTFCKFFSPLFKKTRYFPAETMGAYMLSRLVV